jgi:Spy/CpxP family protein refolding chaperone
MKQIFNKTNLIGLTLAAVLASSSAVTLAGQHCKDKDKDGQHPMERVLKKLDLSETQQAQVDAILAKAREDRSAKKDRSKRHVMMHLDPEASDYLEQAEAHANAASERMKAHMLKMAKTRQQIHAVLNEEQKAELKERMQKKMQRMQEKYEDS